MQLNIKDAEAYRMAKELAELRGQPLVNVVRDALRQQLEQATRDKEARIAALLVEMRDYGRRIRAAEVAAFGDVMSQEAWDEQVYDESGAPR